MVTACDIVHSIVGSLGLSRYYGYSPTTISGLRSLTGTERKTFYCLIIEKQLTVPEM